MEIDQSLGLKKVAWHDRILLSVSTFLFVSMLAITAFQVVIRSLNISIPGGAWWTEPIARYLLIVSTFFGAAVASRNDEHIKMELISNQLDKRVPKIGWMISVSASLLTVFCLIFLTLAALRATVTNFYTPMSVQTIPQGAIYGMISFALVLMVVYESDVLYDNIKMEDEGSEQEQISYGKED